MKRYTDDFPNQLKGLDFRTLEKSQHSIYGFSKDLKLIYFNESWVRFANENHFKGDIADRYPIETPLSGIIRGAEVESFYLKNYKKVLATRQVWAHEYECSSDREFRVFRQVVYPLKDEAGLVVVNSQLVNLPMAIIQRTSCEGIEQEYRQESGLITQCTNCRLTKRKDPSEIWDWVPEWARNIPTDCSLSICPVCFDYYWKYASVNLKDVARDMHNL